MRIMVVRRGQRAVGEKPVRGILFFFFFRYSSSTKAATSLVSRDDVERNEVVLRTRTLEKIQCNQDSNIWYEVLNTRLSYY